MAGLQSGTPSRGAPGPRRVDRLHLSGHVFVYYQKDSQSVRKHLLFSNEQSSRQFPTFLENVGPDSIFIDALERLR